MTMEKFAIQFGSIDTIMARAIPISKREFTAQTAFLEKQLELCAGNECPMEYHSTTHENADVVHTLHYYTVGTGYTILSHYQCKPGRYFK